METTFIGFRVGPVKPHKGVFLINGFSFRVFLGFGV